MLQAGEDVTQATLQRVAGMDHVGSGVVEGEDGHLARCTAEDLRRLRQGQRIGRIDGATLRQLPVLIGDQ